MKASLPKLSKHLLILLLCGLNLFSSKPLSAYSKIISLKPNITEILYALGLGDKIVGVTTYCHHPEAAKKINKVADYVHVFPEKILQLQPDLILASEENSNAKDIYFLMERGITVKRFAFSTIGETLQSILEIGKVTDTLEKAQSLTDKMKGELKNLETSSQGLQKKRVLFVVGYQPLIVAGGHNFFDESSNYIGAVNVASQSKIKFPNYSTEALIASSPDIIVDMAMGSEISQNKEERLGWWGRYGSIPAVKNKQIYFFDIEKMRATPYLPAALQELRQLIHPTHYSHLTFH